jgi:hypothetical protein
MTYHSDPNYYYRKAEYFYALAQNQEIGTCCPPINQCNPIDTCQNDYIENCNCKDEKECHCNDHENKENSCGCSENKQNECGCHENKQNECGCHENNQCYEEPVVPMYENQCYDRCAQPCQSPCTDYTIKKLRPCVKRYYDPVRRHWYNIDKIFDNYCVNPNAAEPKEFPCDSCKYIKTYPHQKTRLDPCTHNYYRINKYYDQCCQPHYQYNQLYYNPGRKPWQNYWSPNYLECGDDPCNPYVPCA